MSNFGYVLKCASCGKEIISSIFFPDSSEYDCTDCRQLSRLFTCESREVAGR